MSRSIQFLLLTLLVAAAPTTAGWDDRFGLIGPRGQFDGAIDDMLVDGNDLYVVGDFYTIDGAASRWIGRWNGSQWLPVGNLDLTVDFHLHVDPAAHVVTKYQGNVVVAGVFTQVNGSAGDLAVWDGSTWAPLGNPPIFDDSNDDIVTLVADGSDLFIGGEFEQRVVHWDGAVLTTLGAGIANDNFAEPAVFDLVLWNGDLIAGGSFHRVDGVLVNHVARWDGAQWHAMGSGVSGLVGELFTQGGDLLARLSDDVVRWTGTGWVSITPETTCQVLTHTYDALYFGGDLYLGGVAGDAVTFEQLPGVARWTGSAWDTMDGGIGNPACGGLTLAEYQNNLLVGGWFSSAGGLPTSNLASWTGDAWLANAPAGRVRAVAHSGTDVFVGGDFAEVAGLAASHVARWDGNAWSSLDNGVNGTVHAMTVIDGDLYVGGEFTNASGSGARHLARWNGTSWSAVDPEFVEGPVYALATNGSDLFVGGDFVALIPSQPAFLRRVARWDGSQWDALGGGISSGSVRALAADGNDLYVGGDLAVAGGAFAGNVARWNGSWSALELGLDDVVRALALHDGDVYAGGDFLRKNGSPAAYQHVARWDGSLWQPIGTGLLGTDQPVRALSASAGGLVVAGDFSMVGQSMPASRIARWTGSTWEAFEQGLDDVVFDVAVAGDELWAGGDFLNADGAGSAFVAHRTLTVTSAPPRVSGEAFAHMAAPYPNPFNPTTVIPFTVSRAEHLEIAVFDVSGRLVRTLLTGVVPAGPQTVSWDGRSEDGRPVASGVYFARLRAGSQQESRKLVLSK